MQSPVLGRPGAVAAPEGHPEEGVPWHFGDPFAEQRAAVRSAAIIDRSHRQVVAVTGSDRLSWLHLVISQHVTELPNGRGTEALILDSHGRVESHLVLAHTTLNDEPTVLLDTDVGAEITSALPKGGAQSLLEYLDAMRFWSDVAVADVTDDWAELTLLGPHADAVLDELELDIDLDSERFAVAAGSGIVARRTPCPAPGGIELFVPRGELMTWWERLINAGAREAGSWAYDALRVESMRPRRGVDTDERTIPHEVGWIGSAAHVAKGCYRGQETVSKVFNVGRPPRNMLLLHIDGSQEIYPETGDPVLYKDRTVGRVGTMVQHHELGPIALALIKRSVPADAELFAGQGDHVAQAAIDPDSVPEEGPAPGRDAVNRLRG